MRGWSAQGLLIALPGFFFALAAASVLITMRSGWTKAVSWGAWTFLFLALLPPLVFTNGEEGDWLPGRLPSEANTA